jgi:RND superfamily putative drug exporter
MALLGPAAWWMPRWLEPVLPRLQLEGSAEATAPAAGGSVLESVESARGGGDQRGGSE